MTRAAPLAPGATIGVLGGGQLGRMLALAAARLGYRIHVFRPERDSPAAEVAAAATMAAWDDEAALDRFAESVDVVTLEFENLPVAAVARIAGRVPVRPGLRALAAAQDRIAEKALMARLDIPTAPWAEVRGAESLACRSGAGTPRPAGRCPPARPIVIFARLARVKEQYFA